MMFVLLRLSTLVFPLLSLLLPPAQQSGHRFIPLSHADQETARLASSRAVHHPQATARWLRHQPVVGSAQVDSFGSIAIQFKDGAALSILPPFQSRQSPVLAHLPVLAPIQTRAGGSSTPTPVPSGAGARALVLEPFATELGLGSTAGDEIAAVLRSAGFSVQVLRDDAVTVAVMETLNQYAFVYMETHSDPLVSGGDAVVATGETNTADYTGMFAEGSLKQVMVAGDSPTHLYDAITGSFIRLHVGAFSTGSIMFVNGCGVVNAPLFWQALADKNLSALIGWDNNVPATFNVQTGRDLMAHLWAGQDVGDAVRATTADGLGVTFTAETGDAHLGFLGEATASLPGARGSAAQSDSSPPPATTPPATPTVTPSATPTATPTATPSPVVRHTTRRKPCRTGYHRVHGKCRPRHRRHSHPKSRNFPV